MYCDWKNLKDGDICTMCDGVSSIVVSVSVDPDGCLVATPVKSFLAGYMNVPVQPVKIADICHNVHFRFDEPVVA
jgi:hypothetical protein